MSSTAFQNNHHDPFDPFALRVATTPAHSLPHTMQQQPATNLTVAATATQPTAFGRPLSVSPHHLVSQFAPKPLSPYTRLSLSTSHSPKESPFSSFNPYFIPPISPSNYCKSPSQNKHNNDWAHCASPSQRRESPRMGVKEANQVWDAQWSPFSGGAANGAASGGAAKAKSPSAGKFSWQWEENGHERDKGDDSTSEEEDEVEEKEERKESNDASPGKKTASFAFDMFDPVFSAPAPVASSTAPSLPLSSKYALPTISPRSFKAALTPKQNRKSAASSVNVSPAVAPVPVPAPSTTTFSLFPTASHPSHPGSPPPPSPTLPPRSAVVPPAVDPVSSTVAPPAMATAAAASVAVAGPSPAVLAAIALLKANTAHNKAITATPEELFADLDTPAHGRSTRQHKPKTKGVVFCDEAANSGGRALAEVHLVPDDFTQYPIPDKRKKKGKGKEKCRVM